MSLSPYFFLTAQTRRKKEEKRKSGGEERERTDASFPSLVFGRSGSNRAHLLEVLEEMGLTRKDYDGYSSSKKRQIRCVRRGGKRSRGEEKRGERRPELN